MGRLLTVGKVAANRLLQPFGIHVARTTPAADVRRIVALLKPIDSGIELIRVGGDHDGGYLLPDDLAGIDFCFSPGVGDTASFELDLEQRGIASFLADYSVDGPPLDLASCRFTKRFLGALGDDRTMSLDGWMADCLADEHATDLLLQMDIEGAEYETLLAASNQTLKRFRIMVVEFHHFESLRDKHFFRIVLSLLRRLREIFEVVHIHPNNARGIRSIGGVDMPQTLEVTFLRKDRVTQCKPVAQLPHPLDQANMPGVRDISLPRDWL